MTASEPPADAVALLAAALLDFDIPAECLPGVTANLAMLADHARRAAGDPPA